MLTCNFCDFCLLLIEYPLLGGLIGYWEPRLTRASSCFPQPGQTDLPECNTESIFFHCCICEGWLAQVLLNWQFCCLFFVKVAPGILSSVLAIPRARTPYLCHILAYWRICTFLLLIIDMWMQPMDKNKSWLFRFSPEECSTIGLNLRMYELKVKIWVNSSPWDVNSHWVTSIVRICRDTSSTEVNDTSEQSCKVAQLPCATRFPPTCRLRRRQMPSWEGRVPFSVSEWLFGSFVLILFGDDEYFSGFTCHISKEWQCYQSWEGNVCGWGALDSWATHFKWLRRKTLILKNF